LPIFIIMPLSLSEAIGLSDTPRMIADARAPYTVLHTNRAWAEVTGYTFIEAANKPSGFLDGPWHGPGTEGPAMQKWRAHVKAGQAGEYVLVFYSRDGQPFRCTISCELTSERSHWLVQYTSPPHPVASEGVASVQRTPAELAPRPPLAPVNYAANDSNEGPVAKRARRTTEKARLDVVLRNSTDPIVLCDSAFPHQIVHANQAWLEMCGYTLEEVEGLTNKILTGPETDEEAIADMLSKVRRKEPSLQTLVNYKAGGQRFINQVRTVPVYDEMDDLAAFMSMLREVDPPALNLSSSAEATSTSGTTHLWSALRSRHEAANCISSAPVQVASSSAKLEAAQKLIYNHVNVIKDMVNTEPSPSQPSLARVDARMAGYAEQLMREVARRLLGVRPGAPCYGCPYEALDKRHPLRPTQQRAWAAAATFLHERIQTEGHRPTGRQPDMSPAAAEAMKQVLREIRTEATHAASKEWSP